MFQASKKRKKLSEFEKFGIKKFFLIWHSEGEKWRDSERERERKKSTTILGKEVARRFSVFLAFFVGFVITHA
jgi:hypothetical protein